MKNRKFLLVLLVMVLAFGIAGCKNEDDDDAFAGTWVTTDPYDGTQMIIVAADGSLKVYQGIEQIRGTYTASGNTVNVTITQINTGAMGGGVDQWINYADAPADIKNEIPQTMQGTISGSQLTINGSIFTKQ